MSSRIPVFSYRDLFQIDLCEQVRDVPAGVARTESGVDTCVRAASGLVQGVLELRSGNDIHMSHVLSSLASRLSITDIEDGDAQCGTFQKAGTAVPDEESKPTKQSDEIGARKMFDQWEPTLENGTTNTVTSGIDVGCHHDQPSRFGE